MPTTTPRMQSRYSWFEYITGLNEADWITQKQNSISIQPNGELSIQNLKTGMMYEAGDFSVYSLENLMANCSTKSNSPPLFEIHIRTNIQSLHNVDVAYLQARAPERSLFQVASNFNCAEVANRWVAPDSGTFVSHLALDSTQGPAASASAGVSAITRIHAPFYNPNTCPSTWGQTMERQIELLGHSKVSPHFPVSNGKLWFEGTEPSQYPPEDTLPKIRVGLHRAVRAYFGQRVDSFMEKFDEPSIIDQIFVAALNRRAPLPHSHHIDSKTKLLLRAAYEGTYLCARLCNNLHLTLTLVGGGSFANPPELIANAIALAHKKWGGQTSLEKVILPLYPLHGHVQGHDFVELLLTAFEYRDMDHLISVKVV